MNCPTFSVFGYGITDLSFSGRKLDVSETFSANQLWFRTILGLFQRCSSPENLWKPVKMKVFRAKNQRWFSLQQRCFLTYSKWRFLVHCQLFRNFLKYFNVKAHYWDFRTNLRKEVKNKNLVVQYCYGPMLKQKLEKVWVSVSAQVEKNWYGSIFQRNFPSSRMNFQNYFKTSSFCCHFREYWGKYSLFWTNEGKIPFHWPLQAFSSLLTTLSQFDIPISACFNIGANSEWVNP